jgi:hypothetical protein
MLPDNAGASILDEALACIGGRIALILIQPGDKDQNYVTSLHNEVVGIFQCKIANGAKLIRRLS